MVRQQLFHLSYLIVIRRLPCLLKNMSVNQYPIQTLLTGLNLRNRDSGDSAAFRLGRHQGSRLLDSLLNGLPIRYPVAWRNPTVKLKTEPRRQARES